MVSKGEGPESSAAGVEAAQLERQAASYANQDQQARLRQLLIDRHNLPQQEESGFERPVIEALDDRGHPVLTNRDDILVRPVDVPRAEEVRGDTGYVLAGTPELVARYVQAGSSRPDFGEFRGRLSEEGIVATPNHICACGQGTTKGGDGPYNTTRYPGPSGDGRAGAGVSIAVIDTGIWDKADDRTDAWLRGIREEPGNIDPLDVVPSGSDGLLDLAAGHGTFVAGLIRQVAPAADVVIYRALDSDGVGTDEVVANAIVRAARTGAQIIHLSLGAPAFAGQPPLAMEEAMKVVDAKVLIVAAAGNNGNEERMYPAAFKRVIAVGALQRDLTPAPWSCRGEWVNVSTVGDGAISTFVQGTREDLDGQRATWTDQEPWALWTGTSFAAPQVTGAIAARMTERRGCLSLFGRRPRAPRDAYDALVKTAPTLPGFGLVVPILSFTP